MIEKNFASGQDKSFKLLKYSKCAWDNKDEFLKAETDFKLDYVMMKMSLTTMGMSMKSVYSRLIEIGKNIENKEFTDAKNRLIISFANFIRFFQFIHDELSKISD